ncbi:MAG: hypothetical protein ACE5IJ_06415, partial [Thermoplasmata archaeon]
YYILKWWDDRKPPEKRDAWGPWGGMLGIAILDLGGLVLLGFIYLARGLAEGFSPGIWFTVLTSLALSVPFLLYIHLALRGYRRRLTLGYGKSITEAI